MGEKTAAKLLNAYGDLDGIFAHLDEQTPKLRENLANNEELARSNATVIPLVRDVPLAVHVDQLQLGGWDLKTAEAAFAKYELKTHWQRIEELLSAGALGDAAAGSAAPSASGTVLTKDAKASLATLRSGTGGSGQAGTPGQAGAAGTPDEPGEVRAELVDFGEVRVPTQAGGGDRGSGGAGRRDPEPGGPLGRRARPQPAEGAGAGRHRGWRRRRRGHAPRPTCCRRRTWPRRSPRRLAGPWWATRSKRCMRSLLPLGIDCTGLIMDTGVAAYLLDASTGEYELSDLRGDDGQLQLSMGDPDAGAPRARPRRMVAEGRDVADLAASFRQQLDALDMGLAPRRHRDAPGPGPGQNGSGRHRHRSGRADQDQRRAEDLGGRRCRPRFRSWPGTSST